MLPVRGDKAVLIRHFRHATRKWHWEIPRGGVDFGQSDQDTALTELREEIGAEVTELVPLGSVHGSTALISGSVSLFLARVSELGKPALDEAIVEIREVSIAEFEHMISGGEVDDSFTICAFLRARLRNLL
jgi:ADP-ribose pyrophosphatase